MKRKHDRENGTVTSWRENITERIVQWRHGEETRQREWRNDVMKRNKREYGTVAS